MIVRITNKLGKKIKVSPDEALEPADNPFLDWAGNSFIADRRHYVLLTHSRSILSCVFTGKGITELHAPLHLVTARLNQIPQCSMETVFPIEAFRKLQANPKN